MRSRAAVVEMFLLVGTGLGAAIGLLHAGLLLTQRASRAGLGQAIWYAAWALALWTLAGAYLLMFWLIGATGLALTRGNRRAAR